MAVRVTVDPELCIGSAECVRIAPGAFRIDETRGISEPTDLAETADPARVDEAVRSCPTGAIALEERAE
ncbi:MAG: ferredoxin [Candidatus Limnocylindria bacterium]